MTAAIHWSRWWTWLMGRNAQAADVAERAQGRLRGRPYLALKHISCTYQDGVLTLRGLAPAHALKRIAEAVARRVEGVAHVENDIEVVALDPWEPLLNRLIGARIPGK